jgi:poly [ADP-ribose] polymerase
MDNTASEEEERALQERLNNFNSGAGVPKSPVRSPSPAPTKTQPSKLKPELQDLMDLIFNTGMFTAAMAQFNIDTAKMPLGKLSKEQINKGYDVLGEIEDLIKSGSRSNAEFDLLTSRFYTLIPHDFGRQRPPLINSAEALKTKSDLLNVLNDIEIAQELTSKAKAKAKKEEDVSKLPKHPYDEKYETLHCDLDVVDKKSKEFKVVETYVNNTKLEGGWGGSKAKIIDVYTVNRHGEDKRFAEHDKLKNRKLLWHGTNVAVVAAILNSGLRIMPHSGGRVGKGIYLADQHGKSGCYVGPANWKGKQHAIMFLAEAALGEEHHITQDNSSLKAAPKGYDCIIARGTTQPDPKADTTLKFDGKEVVVPQGKINQAKDVPSSSFDKSEYLIYKESQHRIRYAIKFEWA